MGRSSTRDTYITSLHLYGKPSPESSSSAIYSMQGFPTFRAALSNHFEKLLSYRQDTNHFEEVLAVKKEDGVVEPL